jgi:transcriptional regulator with XRE-family HTH domain
MKLSSDLIRKLCTRQGLTLQSLLSEAAVSRTAYYSLVRKSSVLPGSVTAIASALGVPPAEILESSPPAELEAQIRLREVRKVLRRHPNASFENVWHTLVLLDEPPVERLRRSLLRGRAVDLH